MFTSNGTSFIQDIKEITLVSSTKVASAGLGFLAVVIVARSLGPVNFGLFSLATGLMLVALEFAGQGIDLSLVRFSSFYLKNDKRKAQLALKAAFKMKLAAASIVLIGGFFLAKPLAIFVFRQPDIIIPLRLIFLGTFGASMWSYVLATLQAHQSFKKYALLDLMNSALKVTFIGILCLVFTGSLLGVLTIYAAIPFLCFFIGLLMIPRKFFNVQGSEKAAQIELFHFGKWIIISGLAAVTYSRLDILMLGFFKKASAVGFYSAAFTLASGIDLLSISVITVLLPKVSKMSQREEFLNYIKKSLVITMPMSVALLTILQFLARPLVLIFFKPEYVNSVIILRILFLGSIVTFITFPISLILFALNLPHYIALSDLGILVFNFLGNYFAIPQYGAAGAAWITMSTRLAMALMIAIFIYFKVWRTAPLNLASFITRNG